MEQNTERYPKTGYVTIVLIVINIIVWLVLEIIGDTENAQFMYEHGAMYPPAIYEGHEYWRFFSAAFLHFGAEHLANNMLILGCAGFYLEEALGRLRYFILYVAAAFGSSILSYLEMCSSNDFAVSAGASGAIFGVIGGLLWVVIRHKGHYESLTTRGMIFMICLSLYYGITTAGVDNWGHIGGLIMGFFFSIILYWRKAQKH